MKDLRQWLEWAVHETHVSAEERATRVVYDGTAADGGYEELNVAVEAASMIAHRALGADFDYVVKDIAYCLTHHTEAFRDLCLSFASAVERMREVVPEAEAEPEVDRMFLTVGRSRDDAMAYTMTGITPLHTAGTYKGPSTLAEWADEVARISAERITALVQAGPVPTPLADGTHCLDRICQCGTYIIRSRTMFEEPNGLHTESACNSH